MLPEDVSGDRAQVAFDSAGEGPVLLDLPLRRGGTARLSPLICFEDTVPATARASARGADILVSISNDAWFDGSCEALQHHAEAAFRAGGAFTLFRTRTVTVSCGQCGGSGAIVLERVTTDGVAGVRLVSDACPRCHGSGHAERRIDTIYTVTRSSP